MNGQKKQQLSLGVLFSYMVIAAKLVSGLVYTPIILYSLGQSEYGVYSLCLSFMGYLTVFHAGMNAAYVRFYVQAREKGDYSIEILNGIFFKIYLILGIVGAVCGIASGVFAEYIFGGRLLPSEYVILKKSLYVLGITVFFSSISGIFVSAIVANERFVAGKLAELFYTILIPVVTVPFLALGFGSIIILEINLVVTIFMLLFYTIYAKKRLVFRIKMRKTDQAFLAAVIPFAGFIAIQGVMDQLNWQVDKYILARFQGAEEVAIYSVGSLFNNYFITITSALSGVFITEINRLTALGKDEELSKLFVKTARISAQIAFFIISAYIIFGKPFICRWSGEEYEKSFYVGMLIMLPVTVSLSQGLGQDIARAKNLHRAQIMINSAVCICNFIISIPLAKYYGAVGSAFGTFLCELVICIVVQGMYYIRNVKIDMKAYYKEMLHLLPGWLLPVSYGVVISSFQLIHKNYCSIFFFGGIYVLVYGFSIWSFSLLPSEKEVIIGRVWKKCKRI